MRVIAGKYKRRALVAPKGAETTRPTSDRARESLFNIISREIEDATLLDLFAGTGALGIEALSRGARHVTFVEHDRAALTALETNLKQLGIPHNQWSIAKTRVETFLCQAGARRLSSSPAESAASVSLVFADPPYNSPWYDCSLESLEASGLCLPECLVALEMSSRQPRAPRPVEGWLRTDERTYGAARMELWRRTQGERPNDEEKT